MAVFPFLQKIDGKQFLIVGDGSIAWRKAELLCLFTNQVTMLTDRTDSDGDIRRGTDRNGDGGIRRETDRNGDGGIRRETDRNGDGGRGKGTDRNGNGEESPRTNKETARPQISPVVYRRRFRPSDLEKADYCIASTDDSGRNHWIAALCRDAGIPVNVPDAPSLCTFYLPSVVKKGDLTVAISTNGKSPALSAHLRREIEKILPSETEEILNRMGELREWAAENIPDTGSRRELYHSILTELLLNDLVPEKEAVLQRAKTQIFDTDL